MRTARVAGGLSVSLGMACFVSVAHAQATRTWVSGVGDDANPCSRTAPCKTFAGAISKTANHGEIDALDPGGFGAVTITKSITIDGTAGLAGVLASSTNAIVISAAANDVVILRNLDINGLSNGLDGVKIFTAGDVRIYNCKIYSWGQRGVFDQRTAGSLAIKDTVVSNNTQTGILALPGGASTLKVNLDRVQMHGNGNAGIALTSGVQGVVNNSLATSNVHGFFADSNSVLNVDHSAAFGNTSTGINAQTGATIRLFDSTIASNATGLSATSGGSILSYGQNRIDGNGAGNGPPTGVLPLQ